MRILRQMRRAERQIKKKWTLAVLLDEPFRALPKALLQLREIHVLFRDLDAGRLRLVEREGRHIVAVGQSEEKIEAIIRGRPEGLHVAEMPFADNRAGV